MASSGLVTLASSLADEKGLDSLCTASFFRVRGFFFDSVFSPLSNLLVVEREKKNLLLSKGVKDEERKKNEFYLAFEVLKFSVCNIPRVDTHMHS